MSTPEERTSRGGGRSVIVGQLVGQLSLVAVTPVITRLVDPGPYGAFQIATAVALILLPIATLRMDFLIPATRSAELVRRRARLANWLVVALGLAVCATAVPVSLLGFADISVPISAALLLCTFGWMAIENAVLLRRGEFHALAWRNALSGVLAAVFQVLLCFVWAGGLALATGMFVGRMVALVLTLRRGAVDNDPGQDAAYGAPRAIRAVASGVVSSAAIYVPTLYAGALSGASAAGQVGLAQRIAGTPTTLLGQGIGQVITASLAPVVRRREPRLEIALRKYLVKLFALSAVLVAAMAVGGPVLAVPVLGPGWEAAGLMLAVFAAPLGLQLVVLPVTPLLVMLERERALLILQSARLVGMLASGMATGWVTGELVPAMVAMSIVWTCAYIATVIVVLRAARQHDRSVSG